jgi:hypothetical protein
MSIIQTWYRQNNEIHYYAILLPHYTLLHISSHTYIYTHTQMARPATGPLGQLYENGKDVFLQKKRTFEKVKLFLYL